MIEIKKLTLFCNDGWMALDGEKKRGIFIYLSEGTFNRKNKDGTTKPIPYRKIRLADIHVVKHPKKGEHINFTRGGKQKFSSVGFYPELAPYVAKLITKISDEISGQPQESEMDRIFEKYKDGRI